MSQIYFNAVCNIAATGAANGNEGLFFEHSIWAECPFELEFATPADAGSFKSHLIEGEVTRRRLVLQTNQWKSVASAKLNTRGWVLQERLLSMRVLHFTKDQVYWDCLELQSSETFPGGAPEFVSSLETEPLSQLKGAFRKSDRTEVNRNEWYDLWRQALIRYSGRDLTVAQDKLIAIGGLARAFNAAMWSKERDELVAGLWKPFLSRELCWCHQERHFCKPRQWRAPSWSWAAVDGEICPDYMQTHAECDTLRDYTSVLQIEEKYSEDSRTLIAASILLDAPPMSATLQFDIDSDESVSNSLVDQTPKACVTVIDGRSLHSSIGIVYFDSRRAKTTWEHETEDVVLLPVLGCEHLKKADFNGPAICALVLRPVDGVEDEYERIGLFAVTGAKDYRSVCRFIPEDRKSIRLR